MDPNRHSQRQPPRLGHTQNYGRPGYTSRPQGLGVHPGSIRSELKPEQKARAERLATYGPRNPMPQTYPAGQGPSAQGTYLTGRDVPAGTLLTGRDDRQAGTRLNNRDQPPPSGKSHYPAAHDQRMASQQSNYNSLLPEKRREQDDWAQIQLRIYGRCPAGLCWMRVTDGYRCAGLGGNGGVHFISDAQLAIGFDPWGTPRR